MKKAFGILSIIFIFGVIFLLILYTPIINKYKNNGLLIINEVMPSNKYTIVDGFNNSSDYIEIYNGYDYDINLEGYYLSDDNMNNRKWVFPNITIKANDYLLVFASELNVFENNELHTNFKLDSSGEVVTLSDKDGNSLSKIYYSKTLEDTTYGYNGKDYVYFYNGTPGSINESLYSDKPITLKENNIKLSITEYMTNNFSSYKSKDGNYYSVIELYNDEDYDINLKDYYLSNDFDNKYIYKFPDVTIKSKDYLVVYLSGLNKFDSELHTNFDLSENDTILVLSDNYKNEVFKVYIEKLDKNISCGLFGNVWKYYLNNSIGKVNSNDYITDTVTKDIRINEVSFEAIELYNLTNNDIDLSNYSIEDNGKTKVNLPKVTLKANSYYVIYTSDTYSYSNGKLYTGFNINSSNETLYLYKNNSLIDEFNVGKLNNNISTGISNNKVYYKNITMGYKNSDNHYNGYTSNPTFSINGGYVDKNTKVSLSADGDIYYTLDGSFPTNKSTKYTNEIEIKENTVIKAIAYNDGLIESDVISRTFITDRSHDVAFVSISTNNSDLFGSNGLLSNWHSDLEKKVSFEFYESDGSLGVSFVSGSKLTGMDSRLRDQKSMAIILRKEYGLQEVTYPFFDDNEVNTYSSFTLRNAGEDPFSIRIQDTVLTNALKDQMDIDMQDFRPVVVYLNGEYYGLYNLREKLNGNYIEHKFNVEKGEYDLIKYATATEGDKVEYDKLITYITTHDTTKKEVYEYLKTQIDMQELCNYLIVESYYGNTDLGNIRYFKTDEGKWRWMLYDLDWSLWSSKLSMSYTVLDKKIPAATYLSSTFKISRNLYKNPEFKDLYLKTLAKHLKSTFTPSRMNAIIDMQAKAIENEMPYHIERWPSMYTSMNDWRSNLNRFKTSLSNRYNYVIKNVKNDFNLSDSEYEKYFGDIE